MPGQYRFLPEANHDCTQLVETVDLVPARLVQRFGKPRSGDGYKVSGTFSFVDDEGKVFTVYDWKATSSYHRDQNDGMASDWPSPDEFWRSAQPYTLSIGGRRGSGTGDFKRWLVSEVG
jgi:hypothetical protein